MAVHVLLRMSHSLTVHGTLQHPTVRGTAGPYPAPCGRRLMPALLTTRGRPPCSRLGRAGLKRGQNTPATMGVTKETLKAGDGVNYPKPGNTVVMHCT